MPDAYWLPSSHYYIYIIVIFIFCCYYIMLFIEIVAFISFHVHSRPAIHHAYAYAVRTHVAWLCH